MVVLIYVMSTVGVSIFSHYCGGELEKITLFSKTKSCCGEETEADMEDGCCKNESIHLAFQKDFTFYSVAKNLKAPVNQLFILSSLINHISALNLVNSSFLNYKRVHPPNLMQDEIVSSSIMRI